MLTPFLRRHVMSSVMSADKIYVLEKGGNVAQIGTHNSLLKDETVLYARMWQKHMGNKKVEIPVESLL